MIADAEMDMLDRIAELCDARDALLKRVDQHIDAAKKDTAEAEELNRQIAQLIKEARAYSDAMKRSIR